MESIHCLNEYEKILTATPQTREMYEDRLAWIDARRRFWVDDKIRVGVIGDTSCGKSTLINAILGMDILSSAVVPSSGILVNCSYGEEPAIIVLFKDKKKITFKGKDINKDNIQKYSDERFNPHNEKKVSTIKFQTPNFIFDRDVILIDSPGLNAYGLEIHESITLEEMLPTIELCMYLTTTKATSDAHTRDVLNKVAKHNKPIIIVQNKLDAVEAAPGGGKSKSQVAEEHYKRVQRIVEKSDIKDKESVDIVQLSAINALKWRKAKFENTKSEVTKQDYIDSRFDEFMQISSRKINNVRPHLEASRMTNIYRSIHELTEELEERISGIDITGPEKKSCNYDEKIADLEYFINGNTERVVSIARKIAEDFNVMLREVDREANDETIETYINKVNKLINKDGNEIYEFIKDVNNNMGKYCRYVNLSVRDVFVTPQVMDYKAVRVTTIQVEEEVKQKKPGFGAAVSRLFNIFSKDKDIGYEYVTEIREKKDTYTIKKDMKVLLKEEKDRYLEILYSWNDTSIQNCMMIKDILIAQKEGYYKRQNAVVQKNELQAFHDKLGRLEKHVKSLIRDTQKWEAQKPVFSDHSTKVEVGSITNDIVDLAESLKKQQNNQVMQSLIKMEGLEHHVPILLGWDENCENRFNWNAGIKDIKIIHLLKDEAPKEGDGIDTCFFVLVNSSQIGMEKKRVKNLNLTNAVEPNDYVIWVVQDFEELLNSDSVVDGLRDMLWLKEFSGIESKSIVWISHDNPVYNIAFLEQQFYPSQDIAEEQTILRELKESFPTYCDEEIIGNVAKILKVRA